MTQSDIEHDPVGDDLDAGVAIQRRKRPIDRGKRADAALARETPPAARARAAHRDWRARLSPRPSPSTATSRSNERHRAEMCRQLLAILAG